MNSSSLYHPKTLLVTGGAGFIGSNFVRQQNQRYPQRKIINLDKLTYAGSLENLQGLENPQQHQFIHGDIAEFNLVQQILSDYKIDTIVHFAAESHVCRSLSHPEDFIQSNIVGTFNLLEAARQLWSKHYDLAADRCRFHHISTDEVYGSLEKNDPTFLESSPYDPSSPYSASKASSDHLVRAYFRSYGLPITLSNCSNNYGPYQHSEKLIPKVMQACFNLAPITVYGDGTAIRDWLYVGDHCDAIDRILTQGLIGESYNVGGCHEVNNLDIIQQICNLMDSRVPQPHSHTQLIEFVADRPGADWRYGINIQKIKNELQWQPTTLFEQGLSTTFDYYYHLHTTQQTTLQGE